MRSLFRNNGMALLLAVLVLPAAAATPEPNSGQMVATWTTWMRAGPSEQDRAIDEIGTGTAVQVESCQNGWCRIQEGRAAGYVEQRYLATALQTLKPGTGDCFQAKYYTAENPLPITLCPAKP